MPSKYIEFVNRDENIDFDVKMVGLQKEFAVLLHAEQESKNDLLTVFKELGYEINHWKLNFVTFINNMPNEEQYVQECPSTGSG